MGRIIKDEGGWELTVIQEETATAEEEGASGDARVEHVDEASVVAGGDGAAEKCEAGVIGKGHPVRGTFTNLAAAEEVWEVIRRPETAGEDVPRDVLKFRFLQSNSVNVVAAVANNKTGVLG